MAAQLTIPQFLARSQALEARLREVLPEYTLLHGQYEDVRNNALPELNGAPGGNAGFNINDAGDLKQEVDAAFAGIMDVIQEICAVNNMGGGQRRRKRRARKTRRNK
jgi:hypothetical protein